MTRRLLFLFGLMVIISGLPWTTSAETVHVGEETGKPEPAPEPTGDLTETLGLPYSQILRNTEPPYQNVFQPLNLGGRLEPKVGGLRGQLLPDISRAGVAYHVPLEARGAPTNAEIKVGRFYLDLLALSGSVLYSDNVNREEHNRNQGAIGIVTLSVLGVFQITDDLRLAFKTGFVWLPFKNQFGVWGFMRDPIAGKLFSGGQSTLAQLSYDLRLGEWDVQFYDYLRGGALFSEGSYMYLGEPPPDEEDRAGRYVFRGRTGTPNRVNEPTDRLYDTSFRLWNTVGGTVRRLLPTVTRLEIGAYHIDYWNVQNDGFNLPYSRDVAYVMLSSERESLRFKPFVTYRVSRYNEDPWNQEVRGGLRGPITENLQLVASAGWYIYGQTGAGRLVNQVRLRHTINPQTFQEFGYWRDITSPEEDLENTYAYRLHHTFGPYLSSDAYAAYSTFEDLNKNGTGTEEWRTGVIFTLSPSSKTVFRVGGWYWDVRYDNPVIGRWQRWTALAQVGHTFGEKFDAMLAYQYQQRNSTFPNDSYFENLVVLTLTYYFGERYGSLTSPYITTPSITFGR